MGIKKCSDFGLTYFDPALKPSLGRALKQRHRVRRPGLQSGGWFCDFMFWFYLVLPNAEFKGFGLTWFYWAEPRLGQSILGPMNKPDSTYCRRQQTVLFRSGRRVADRDRRVACATQFWRRRLGNIGAGRVRAGEVGHWTR